MAKRKKKKPVRRNPRPEDRPATDWVIPEPRVTSKTCSDEYQETLRLADEYASSHGMSRRDVAGRLDVLNRRYLDAFAKHPDAVPVKDIPHMDTIDLTGALTYVPGPDDVRPEFWMPELPSPEVVTAILSSYPTPRELFYACLPCFRKGIVRVNEGLYGRFEVLDLEPEGLSAVIRLMAFTVEDPKQTVASNADSLVFRLSALPAVPDVRATVRNIPSLFNWDPSPDCDPCTWFGCSILEVHPGYELFTCVKPSQLGWTKPQTRLWEAVRIQASVNSTAMYETPIEQRYVDVNRFLYYVMLANYYLDSRRVVTVMDDRADDAAPHVPGPKPGPLDPDEPLRKVRSAGPVRFRSVKTPKRATAETVARQYRLASWGVRGHVRRYKSGKVVYIAAHQNHRKVLAGRPSPKQSTVIRVAKDKGD